MDVGSADRFVCSCHSHVACIFIFQLRAVGHCICLPIDLGTGRRATSKSFTTSRLYLVIHLTTWKPSTTLSVYHQKDGQYIKRGEIVGLPGYPEYIPTNNEIVEFKSNKDVYYQIKLKDERTGNILLQSVRMVILDYVLNSNKRTADSWFYSVKWLPATGATNLFWIWMKTTNSTTLVTMQDQIIASKISRYDTLDCASEKDLISHVIVYVFSTLLSQNHSPPPSR